MCELVKEIVKKEDKTYINVYVLLENGVKVCIKPKFDNKIDYVRLVDNAKIIEK